MPEERREVFGIPSEEIKTTLRNTDVTLATVREMSGDLRAVLKMLLIITSDVAAITTALREKVVR